MSCRYHRILFLLSDLLCKKKMIFQSQMNVPPKKQRRTAIIYILTRELANTGTVNDYLELISVKNLAVNTINHLCRERWKSPPRT
ncbi:hypothetical protein FKM82_002604 [Ascaphus truei]